MGGKSNVIRLLRIASGLWIAYLGLSAIIDYGLKSPGPLERFYYLADLAIAVFFMVISFWTWIQQKLGRVFLPLMIILICSLPILVNQVLVGYWVTGPLPPPEAVLTRVAPFLLIALILVAWQYKWQHILIFILAIALVNVLILRYFSPDDRAVFSNGLFASITQIVTFLVVGFFINILVSWLQKERRALEEANSKLTNYARTLEDLAVTRERNRIAQELHDTLSHTLSGLSVQLETMKAYWEIDPPTARKSLDKSLNAARAGLDETRRVLIALRAKPLEEMGLAEAIRQMAEEAAGRTGLKLNWESSGIISAITPDVEQGVFRIAQEALTNVSKHAKAKILSVKLRNEENKLTLSVIDDGVGFNIDEFNGNRKFGLQGMRERAAFIKGELDIISRPQDGTIIKLTVLLEPNK